MWSICAAVAEYFLSGGQSTRLEELTHGREELLLPIRVIRSTDCSVFDISEAAADIPVLDFDTLRSLASFLVPLFKGLRLIFSSVEIALAEYAGHSRASFLFDYSFSFDANVADKIRAYLLGSNLQPADKARVIQLIRLIKQHHWRLDIMPCVAENVRHAQVAANQRPVETVWTFRLLDQLDTEAFVRNPERAEFRVDPITLRQQAERDMRELLALGNRSREASVLGTYAMLLKLSELWLVAPREPEKNFSRLVDFCLFEIGAFAKLELSIALDFLRNPRGLAFFGPLTGLGKDLLKELRGMAWDIQHYRLLLTHVGRCTEGAFFIPVFVTFDRRWADLMRAKAIDVLVIDRSTAHVETLLEGEYEFRVALNDWASGEAKDAMADLGAVDARIKRGMDRERAAALVTRLEASVEALLQTARSSPGRTSR